MTANRLDAATPPLGRRSLMAGAAGLVLGTGGLPIFGGTGAAASAIPANNRIAFDVFRGDSPMGRHTLEFSRAGDQTIVDIAVDLEVKVAFLTAFQYTHRNREIWEGDRLISLESQTNDNGDAYEVSVRQDGEGLLIRSTAHGEQTVPADTMPGSYWNARTVGVTQLIDGGQGRVLDVSVVSDGQAALRLQGETTITDRYQIDGTIPIRVWYTQTGQWVGLQFSARGSDVTYRLADDSGLLAG